jgi:hypothetical protein
MFTTNAIGKRDIFFIFLLHILYFITTNTTFLLLSRHEVAKLENKSFKGKHTCGRSLLLKRQSYLQSKNDQFTKILNW